MISRMHRQLHDIQISEIKVPIAKLTKKTANINVISSQTKTVCNDECSYITQLKQQQSKQVLFLFSMLTLNGVLLGK